jgi:signal transduction histidine kinase
MNENKNDTDSFFNQESKRGEIDLRVTKKKMDEEKKVVNKELTYQNGKKEKRADELIVANKELAYQNEEKEKRAAELITANIELIFQNEEKEKRAGELIVANKELAYQNEEKEKRAAELIIANIELVFQNEEKEKHAEELLVAIRGLKNAEDEIRKLNAADIRKLNEELEQKVLDRTSELESAIKEMESFSYSISHDLRAPLRAVDAYSKIIEENYGELFDDEGKRLLSVVQRNAKKMGVLIDDLLAFSRLGRKEIHKTNVNMKQLAENVADELNTFTPNKAKIIINALEPILADSTLMHQVWMNLLSNAIKYSIHTQQPLIEINCEKKNQRVVYSISDNGAGFDMRYVDKLFGVFQRLHSANEFEGTGVGLALVHRIITKHRGEIWANAEVGKGATFYFSLPKKQPN